MLLLSLLMVSTRGACCHHQLSLTASSWLRSVQVILWVGIPISISAALLWLLTMPLLLLQQLAHLLQLQLKLLLPLLQDMLLLLKGCLLLTMLLLMMRLMLFALQQWQLLLLRRRILLQGLLQAAAAGCHACPATLIITHSGCRL